MHEIKIKDALRSYGLICHTFSFEQLPESLQNRISTACDIDFANSYLSLLANAGGEFWTALKTTNLQDPEALKNPVDEFSRYVANRLLQIAELETDANILYPDNTSVPLMSLGEHADWSTPSPLGLGLHAEYGPWLAYRALVKTTKPMQSTERQSGPHNSPSPCLSCVSTPCVSACPASAVNPATTFNLNRCAEYRVQDESECKTQCHARNACPVGIEYRYSEEQRAYHMTRALSAMENWLSDSEQS